MAHRAQEAHRRAKETPRMLSNSEDYREYPSTASGDVVELDFSSSFEISRRRSVGVNALHPSKRIQFVAAQHSTAKRHQTPIPPRVAVEQEEKSSSMPTLSTQQNLVAKQQSADMPASSEPSAARQSITRKKQPQKGVRSPDSHGVIEAPNDAEKPLKNEQLSKAANHQRTMSKETTADTRNTRVRPEAQEPAPLQATSRKGSDIDLRLIPPSVYCTALAVDQGAANAEALVPKQVKQVEPPRKDKEVQPLRRDKDVQPLRKDKEAHRDVVKRPDASHTAETSLIANFKDVKRDSRWSQPKKRQPRQGVGPAAALASTSTAMADYSRSKEALKVDAIKTGHHKLPSQGQRNAEPTKVAEPIIADRGVQHDTRMVESHVAPSEKKDAIAPNEVRKIIAKTPAVEDKKLQVFAKPKRIANVEKEVETKKERQIEMRAQEPNTIDAAKKDVEDKVSKSEEKQGNWKSQKISKLHCSWTDFFFITLHLAQKKRKREPLLQTKDRCGR